MRAELAALRAHMDMVLSGTAAPKAVATSAAPKAAPSPFDTWEPEDIRLWIKDADPSEPAPAPRLGKAKLIEIADRVAAKLQADQSVAA